MMNLAARSLYLILASSLSFSVFAEPFLAIKEGYQCGQCHVNVTGGGLRNAFGSAYSQSQLAADSGGLDMSMFGQVNERLTIGADARLSGRVFDVPSQDSDLGFATDRVTLYVSGKLSDTVEVYLDQQLAPGGAINREAWAKVDFDQFYLRAGRFFLPYGMRIEDDSAYIRQYTGINFNVPDSGLEFGYTGKNVSGQLSVTNGTGGAPEIDGGKQANIRVAWVDRAWRVGVSGSQNDTDSTDRTMYGVFAGLRTGPVSWIVEFDSVTDDSAGAEMEQELAFIEANWLLTRGHYIRLVAESRSVPGIVSQDSERLSLEYQWFPVPFTQLRVGGRTQESDDPAVVIEQDEYFVQLHVYF